MKCMLAPLLYLLATSLQPLHGQCKQVTTIDTEIPGATIVPPLEGDSFLRGSVVKGNNSVRVVGCVQSAEPAVATTQLGPVVVQADDSFVIPYGKELKGGDIVMLQTFRPGTGNSRDYGPFTSPIKTRISCAKEVPPGTSKPTNNVVISAGISGKSLSVKGSAKDFSGKSLRLCKDDEPVPNAVASIAADGSFAVPTVVDTTGAKEIRIQIMDGGKPDFLSDAYPLNVKQSTYRDARYILVGGYESFWFSSQGQKSEPFVKLFLEGPEFSRNGAKHGFFSPWGDVRLLGTPQASTNGVGSTFVDPTGKISKQDFSTVGTSLDWQLGFEEFITRPGVNWGRTSFIAGFGATNPLSAQDSPIFFKAPPQGTTECAELLKRFTPANGYPVLTPGDTSTVSCLKSAGIAVTDIAFTNQDRTSAFWKWQAGFRAEGALKCTGSYTDCSDSFGLLDLTVGQDAAMTRGQVRNFVFKADGTFPIKTGDRSYLYLYGSSYLRFKHNVDSQPLLLTGETSPPTLPNAAVVVLPLKQPDRDFFRIGIGVNLGQVFCRLSIGPCNAPATEDIPTAGGDGKSDAKPGGATPAPTGTTKKVPTPASSSASH